MVKEIDLRSILVIFANKLGLSIADTVVQKSLRLVEKGLPLNHILAELLLYSHLKTKGYDYISIEETIGSVQCDVYVKRGVEDICIEVETHTIPIEYILEGHNYIIARHIKKVIQISKEGIKFTSFAYPYGVIPLIPLELLKHPEYRSQEELERLASITRRFYALDFDYLVYLERCVLGDIYVYDITTLNVYRLSKESLVYLVSLYTKTIFSSVNS